ncbi:MAG: hypothetical protein MI922_15400, partial [Bacteroidales bacterium]|nr:hypothetical protein [Bacteroidales bacterium]
MSRYLLTLFLLINTCFCTIFGETGNQSTKKYFWASAISECDTQLIYNVSIRAKKNDVSGLFVVQSVPGSSHVKVDLLSPLGFSFIQ